MFDTLEEAEGYTQLGKNIVPHGDAFHSHSTTERLADLGSQALDASLGKDAFPDLSEVLDLRYGGHYQLDMRPPGEIMSSTTSGGASHNLLPDLEIGFPDEATINPLDNVNSPFKFDGIQNVVSDLCKTLVSGPIGIFAAVLGFLVAIFSAVIQATGQFLTEAAQSAASMAGQIWKKQLEAT